MASPRPADEDEGGELLAAAAGAAVTVAAGRRALGGPADKEVQAGAKEAAERECRQNAPVAVLRVAGGHGVGGGWAVKLLAGQRLSLGRGGGPGGGRQGGCGLAGLMPAADALMLSRCQLAVEVPASGAVTAGRRTLRLTAQGTNPSFIVWAAAGKSWLTAAIPMENPHCSCMLTRVCSRAGSAPTGWGVGRGRAQRRGPPAGRLRSRAASPDAPAAVGRAAGARRRGAASEAAAEAGLSRRAEGVMVPGHGAHADPDPDPVCELLILCVSSQQ